MPAGKTMKGDYFSTINVQCIEPDQIFFHRFGTGAVSVIQHIPSPMKSCLVCILANVGTEIKKKTNFNFILVAQTKPDATVFSCHVGKTDSFS